MLCLDEWFLNRGCQEMIADSRTDIEAARLLTLSCAAAIDANGAIKARDQIAMIKVAVPNLVFKVIDRAIQVRTGLLFFSFEVNILICILAQSTWVIIICETFFRFMEVQVLLEISH